MTNPNSEAPRTGSDEAVAGPYRRVGLGSPSTWAGIWVLLALVTLAAMRRSIGRLG